LTVTPQQVLDRLAGVLSPRGVALTDAGVLSEIAVNDDRVFFSINVETSETGAWEGVRAQAEAAVRAIPGVSVAMVALTAERKPGDPAYPPPRSGQGIPHVSTHRSPPLSGSPMARQTDIPGVAAVIAVASGKAASASRPLRSILRSACGLSVCGSVCSMRTSTDPRYRD
jgi:ATP-binding protein involved in chromosome partitioning